MHLSEINIYPIKSLKGISLNEAIVEERGLRFDRRWMLVDQDRQFITQREVPRMATVEINVGPDGLIASANGSQVAVNGGSGEMATVTVWSSSVKAEFYPREIDDWFSHAIGVRCRLVQMPESTRRIVSP